jgi:hypothetical protein
VPQGLPKGIEKTRITIGDNIKRETKMGPNMSEKKFIV